MVDETEFREHLRRRGLQRVSVDSYLRDAGQFCDFLNRSGISDIGAVTEQKVRLYCEHMAQKGLAPVSMQRKLASLKRLFEYLLGMGQARLNPVVGVNIRRPGASRAKALTDEQLDRLLSMPDTRSAGGIRDKAMFALISSTGIKVSELIALRTGDLQLGENRLRIRRQNFSVTIALDDGLCRCLQAYLLSRGKICPEGESALFLNVYGKSITRQGVWKSLKKYADSADLEGVTLETIRRSFARRYLGEGHDIRSLCDILGHSNVSVTRAYVKS